MLLQIRDKTLASRADEALGAARVSNSDLAMLRGTAQGGDAT